MRFRKKPIVIDAMPFSGSELSVHDILKWAGPKCGIEARFTSLLDTPRILVIQTFEGEMRALPGDWIIKGVKGEFYPCKPDIFVATYERADAEGVGAE